MLSKHGVIYNSSGDEWDWELPLALAFEQGGQTAPTCQTCHMEYDGEYSTYFVDGKRKSYELYKEGDRLEAVWYDNQGNIEYKN